MDGRFLNYRKASLFKLKILSNTSKIQSGFFNKKFQIKGGGGINASRNQCANGTQNPYFVMKLE